MHLRLGRDLLFPNPTENDAPNEPVKNVPIQRHHRQRQFNNLAEPFQAFFCLSESVDCDGKT
jgi:hypothetical protein